MPVLDTELLFALNPEDRLHSRTLRLLADLREQGLTLYAPDTAILEFNAVLRSAYKEPRAIRNATLALRQALGLNGAKEASTLDTHLIARQCEIEEKHDLTYFDSLIAASALRLDQTVVSSDPSFDKVPGLARKALP